MRSRKENAMSSMHNHTPSLARLLQIYAEIETDRLHKLGYTNLRVIAKVKENENSKHGRMECNSGEGSVQPARVVHG